MCTPARYWISRVPLLNTPTSLSHSEESFHDMSWREMLPPAWDTVRWKIGGLLTQRTNSTVESKCSLAYLRDKAGNNYVEPHDVDALTYEARAGVAIGSEAIPMLYIGRILPADWDGVLNIRLWNLTNRSDITPRLSIFIERATTADIAAQCWPGG